jgi:hypothetical protein
VSDEGPGLRDDELSSALRRPLSGVGPPAPDLAPVLRRARRLRIRRYAVISVSACAIVAGVAVPLARLSFLRSGPGPAPGGEPPSCSAPTIPGLSSFSFTRRSGPAGTTVLATGPTLRNGQGLYAGGRVIELWWNRTVPGGQPQVAGQRAFLLGTLDAKGKCTFHLAFQVPQVPPGIYPVAILRHRPQPRRGIDTTVFTFTVTKGS